MPAEKANAIVLRVVDFSESSCVLTLFTDRFGKVRALAKGARRPKGPFESAIDLLALCRIVFLAKSTDALDLLTEAKLERWFRATRGDLSRLYAGYYVAEFVDALTDDRDPQPDLFALAEGTLAALSAPRPMVLPRGMASAPNTAGTAVGTPVDPLLTSRHVFHFELAALRLTGHLPSLETCVECGASVEPTGRVAFGYLAGGVLCAKCRPGQRAVVSISGQALRAMQALSTAEVDAGPTIELTKPIRGELRGVLNHYIAHLLNRPPRMQRYLSEL